MLVVLFVACMWTSVMFLITCLWTDCYWHTFSFILCALFHSGWDVVDASALGWGNGYWLSFNQVSWDIQTAFITCFLTQRLAEHRTSDNRFIFCILKFFICSLSWNCWFLNCELYSPSQILRMLLVLGELWIPELPFIWFWRGLSCWADAYCCS